MNQKRGICRHHILYPLQLGLPFPNDIEIIRLKVGLGPNYFLLEKQTLEIRLLKQLIYDNII